MERGVLVGGVLIVLSLIAAVLIHRQGADEVVSAPAKPHPMLRHEAAIDPRLCADSNPSGAALSAQPVSPSERACAPAQTP